MTPETLEAMATSAFENLKKAREALFIAAEISIATKDNLEKDKAAAISANRFDGKNAETREAQSREYLSAQYGEVSDAEHKERTARYAFDVASIDADTVKTMLRIAELK